MTLPRRLILASGAAFLALALAALASRSASLPVHGEASLLQGTRLHFAWFEPLSGAELPLRVEAYRACRNGRCDEQPGPVTLAEALTATLGTTATLFPLKTSPPHRWTATAYRADDLGRAPAGDGRTLWRPTAETQPVALDMLLSEARGFPEWMVRLPSEEGLWVLDLAADWPDEVERAARWAVLVRTIDGTGEQSFVGVYMRGSEGRHAFYRSLDGCASGMRAWFPTDAPGVRFDVAFEAFCDGLAGAPGRTDSWREWPAAEIRFRGIVGPRDPTFVSTAPDFGHYARNIVVTSELELRPTNSCGMDVGDLLVADARVTAVECRGGIPFERLGVEVRNIGSQPVGPYDVTVRGAAPRGHPGPTIVAWSSSGLAEGDRATFRFDRYRFDRSPDAVAAAAAPVTWHSERFNARNNKRAVDLLPGWTGCPVPRAGEASQRLWLPVLAKGRRWRP